MDDLSAKYWRERLQRFIRNAASEGARARLAAGGDEGQRGVAGDLVGSDRIEPRRQLREDEKGDGGRDPDVADETRNCIKRSSAGEKR